MKAFVLGVLSVVLACGGQVGGNPDGGDCPTSPTGMCSNEGEKCDFQTTMCGVAATETCQCTAGGWQCPEYQCAAEVCPSTYAPIMPCHQAGLKCNVPGTFCGGTVDVPCTCDGSQFACEPPGCPSLCPPPETIFEGFSCDAPMGTQCTADLCGQPTTCTCSGAQWSCGGVTGGDCDGGVAIDATGSD